ncbi:MAG: hypothetical protein K1X67_03390 [Fimbriimonadaceae bacterium]|nr:hypothetical protein [Fimbriimonadaceae bacterium]
MSGLEILLSVVWLLVLSALVAVMLGVIHSGQWTQLTQRIASGLLGSILGFGIGFGLGDRIFGGNGDAELGGYLSALALSLMGVWVVAATFALQPRGPERVAVSRLPVALAIRPFLWIVGTLISLGFLGSNCGPRRAIGPSFTQVYVLPGSIDHIPPGLEVTSEVENALDAEMRRTGAWPISRTDLQRVEEVLAIRNCLVRLRVISEGNDFIRYEVIDRKQPSTDPFTIMMARKG